jgi:hypothetical protein
MNLNNILAKAQQMMLSEEWNRDVERAAKAQRGGKSDGDDFSAMEDAIFGVSSGPSGYDKNPIPESVNYRKPSSDGVQMIQPSAEKRTGANSKIPKAILESFKKTPSPVEAFNVPTSAVEQAMNGLAKMTNEQAQVQPRQQYQPQQGGQIDYNYLKYIINECVKENMKGALNESAQGGNLVGMKISAGNKFQFLDSKGNLYEAHLTLKKKAAK